MDKDILFVCRANVGRSQIAEAYYNSLAQGSKAISAALLEDRRSKYNFIPAEGIIGIMQEDDIDITSQKIKLLSEIKTQFIDQVKYIVSLDQPSMLEGGDIDAEFFVKGKSGPVYLQSFKEKLIVRNIKDPYQQGIVGVRQVRNEIKEKVYSLFKATHRS